MGVDHGGAHILVAEKLLDCSDVIAILKQVGRKGVAESVAARRLGYPGSSASLLYSLLQNRLVEMVPLSNARSPVGE